MMVKARTHDCPTCLALLLLLCLMATGCANSWARYEDSLVACLQDPSVETQERHMTLLQRIIDEAQAGDRCPPPGICLEYAFLLGRAGRWPEAQPYLAKEIECYPEAAILAQITQRLSQDGSQVLQGSQIAPEKTGPTAKEPSPGTVTPEQPPTAVSPSPNKKE